MEINIKKRPKVNFSDICLGGLCTLEEEIYLKGYIADCPKKDRGKAHAVNIRTGCITQLGGQTKVTLITSYQLEVSL